jgi:poly(hydroxyalkanoate) depolymerase family esterase
MGPGTSWQGAILALSGVVLVGVIAGVTVAATGPEGAHASATALGADHVTGPTQVEGTFETHPFEGREYLAYVPSGAAPAGGYPVVVMLHGCGQDPRGFDTATGMSRVAEAETFVVVYPEQTNEHNAFACWNWFQPSNYERGAGEARLIAGMTDDALDTYDTDRSRVYIAGLSSGAAMANNVAGEYPDLYAAVGSHSGLEYHAVEDPNKAVGAQQSGGIDPVDRAERAYRRAGDRARPLPAIVFQGTGDAQVNRINGNQTVAWAVHLADLAVDGELDGDVDTEPETVEHTRSAGGVNYTHYTYDLADRTIVEYYLLEARHAWSGGNGTQDYTLPAGPPASELLWAFFANHTHPSPSFDGPTPKPTTAVPTDTPAEGTPTTATGGDTTTAGSDDPTAATTTTVSPTSTATASPTSGSGPGFAITGVLAAITALLFARLPVSRRRR